MKKKKKSNFPSRKEGDSGKVKAHVMTQNNRIM